MLELKPESEAPPPDATSTELLITNLEGYIRTSVELAGVEASVKAIRLLSQGLHIAMLCGLAIFFLLFAGFGMAWWIGESFQTPKFGFLIVGGIYLTGFTLVWLLRTPMLLHLRNYLTRISHERGKEL